MSQGFDEPVNRRDRNATRWRAVEQATSEDGEPVIPLWIADMEFRTAPVVLEAMQEALTHGIIGYQEWSADFPQLFCRWQADRHHWAISPEWILPCQSVIGALDVIFHTLTQPGDEIIEFSPGFGAFGRVIRQSQRQQVTVPLKENGAEYILDPATLEACITPRSRMLILCNPHNPLGKIWGQDELRQIIAICQRHNLLLLSDDVHQDLHIQGAPYTSITSLSDAIADNAITFTSPCKTFNFSGLPVTNMVIKNPGIRERLRAGLVQRSIHKPDALGMIACEAAYRDGAPWLDALCQYLHGNVLFLQQALHQHTSVRLFNVQGSYLGWLDFRSSGLSQSMLEARLIKKAGVLLESGTQFGDRGEGFMRLNFALPRAELAQAISRIQHSFGHKNA
ncbi:MalY/PatB family protein [Phytobacter sp. V91]|uniref:MalY/PatB family protein n=1 Tax=Phytobacter sp. V91 TaxID=3369425 RepID=UPI003F61FA77